MAQVFTPNFLDSCKSYLQNPGHVDTDNIFDFYPIDGKYDQYYFQILIFENPKDEEDEPTLVIGKKEELLSTYFENCREELSCPTKGITVNTNFVTTKETEYSTIYFLLQCRKLSQLLSYTWLENDVIESITNSNISKIEEFEKLSSFSVTEKDEKIQDALRKLQKIKLVRKILNTYNIIPRNTLDGEGHKLVGDIALKQKILNIEKGKKDKTEIEQCDRFLIKPESQAYGSISLALLLSGNAYYREKIQKNQDSDQQKYKMIRIQEPILSNYEIVWDNALEMSWDTFFTTKEDVSQAGMNPQPPYHKMIIGYPVKPYECTDKDSKYSKVLQAWATAPDDSGSGKYPFYPPEQHSSKTEPPTDWENKKLKFVLPPYPYIPVTCG